MSSLLPYWWLLLPLMILPVLWLRQRRESSQRQGLATAKFLAAASPHMVQVWRWQAWLLLMLRCLLLLIAIAYLASIFIRWRGDTVLIAAGSDRDWIEQEIKANNMQDAKRMSFCAELSCDIQSTQILYWLEQHQSGWKESARLLVLGDASQIALNAQAPQLVPALTVKVATFPTTNVLGNTSTNTSDNTKKIVENHYIAVRSDRVAAWQHLFAAFAVAGKANQNYVWQQEPDASTELVIWDSTQAVPQQWKTKANAAFWWLSSGAGLVTEQTIAEPQPNLQTLIDGKLHLKQFKNEGSRYWLLQAGSDWPLQLNDSQNAKRLFEAWQKMSQKRLNFPTTSFSLPTNKNLRLAQQQENTRDTLLVLLLCIFALERIFTHVRRR